MFFVLPVMSYQSENINFQSVTPRKTETIVDNSDDKIDSSEYLVDYIPYTSIEIISDDDFGNYSSSGTGTLNDPFVIENFIISTTNSTGILIQDTTKHFKIQNCIIDADSRGISVKNITSNTGIIENNTCINNSFTGIYARDAPNTTIVNNTCQFSYYYAMRIIDCNESKVISNFCTSNTQGGITVESCFEIEIRDNVLIDNGYSAGILVDYSDFSIIENNTCINNERYGIRLRTLTGALVSENCVNNTNTCTGIELFDTSEVSVSNNTVYSDRSSIYLVDSLGTEIKHNNMYFSGLAMNYASSTDFLSFDIQYNLVNSKKLGFFNNIEQSTFSEPEYGQIILANSQDITIENQGIDNKFIGVSLHYCKEVTIQHSLISSLIGPTRNTAWGIKVYDSVQINVIGNICKDGGWGISMRNASHSVIKSNTCKGNRYIGILLTDSDFVSIINNTIELNQVIGIWLNDCDYSDVVFNYLERNGDAEVFNTGLRIEYFSRGNCIHHNSFIDNNFNGTPQAVDQGEANFWYDFETMKGNFWSDLSSANHYSIYGYANATDLYPLSEIPIYKETNETRYNFVLVLFPLLVYCFGKISKRKRRLNVE
jgi:parallel beta-helix repeat protein